MFIKVASSPRLSGIGMPSPILWSHPLKMQRIVLLSSLLWWELGTNSLITGPGEWLSFRRFTSNYPDPDPDGHYCHSNLLRHWYVFSLVLNWTEMEFYTFSESDWNVYTWNSVFRTRGIAIFHALIRIYHKIVFQSSLLFSAFQICCNLIYVSVLQHSLICPPLHYIVK